MDSVPLKEIDRILEMQDGMISMKDGVHTKYEASNKTMQSFNTIQIKTIPNGFNSGRAYYLRPRADSPDDVCRRIVEQMGGMAESAKKRAIVVSHFKRVQQAMRSLHDSLPFQALVSMLIMAV